MPRAVGVNPDPNPNPNKGWRPVRGRRSAGAARARAKVTVKEGSDRAEGLVGVGCGGAKAREAAVEWRGEDLEAHAEGRAQLLERGLGAGRLHATAALIAALQREQG